jgi:hypothetical protein
MTKLYVLKDNQGELSSWGITIEADTISELVRMVIEAEFNPDTVRGTYVVKRIPVEPVITYKEERV